jgi:two-component system, chemotaxis family, CheB/CheR fusion protein
MLLAPSGAASPLQNSTEVAVDTPVADGHRTGVVLVVDDDPDVCELLELVLTAEGHQVATASDGMKALELSARGALQPDLILADYNLPNGMSGIEIIAKLREQLGRQIPAIMLTGDISTGTLDAIARQDCVQLNKPVKLPVLSRMIQVFLRRSQSAAHVHVPPSVATAVSERHLSFRGG